MRPRVQKRTTLLAKTYPGFAKTNLPAPHWVLVDGRRAVAAVTPPGNLIPMVVADRRDCRNGDREHARFQEEEAAGANSCEGGVEASVSQEVGEEIAATGEGGVAQEGRREGSSCEEGPGQDAIGCLPTSGSSFVSGSCTKAKDLRGEGAGLRRRHGDLVHYCWQRGARGDPTARWRWRGGDSYRRRGDRGRSREQPVRDRRRSEGCTI